MRKNLIAELLMGFAILAGFMNYALPAAAQNGNSGAATSSLYTRLGGYDALAAVTDDFITAWQPIPAWGSFSPG